jgi:ADP-heptose:LPS heptosyltransferase
MLSRRWSLDKFAEVAAWLHGTGYRVVLTGAPFEAPLAHALAERMTCPFVNVAGQTSVGGMAGLLKHARLLVSNDTGVSHIAAGLQVPSVVIVLGSQPDRWAPLNAELHRTVMHPIDCRPCSHFECPIGFGCEQRVTVEQVIRTIRNILGVEPTDSGASFMSMSSSVPPSPTLTPATPLIASTEVLPLDWVPPIDAESDRKERCRAIESVA